MLSLVYQVLFSTVLCFADWFNVLYCSVLSFSFSCINKKTYFSDIDVSLEKSRRGCVFHKKNFDFLSGEHCRQAGSMSVEHFRHLVEISSINSRKVICALEDFFCPRHDKKRSL